MESKRDTAARGERAYPAYAAVVQDLQSKVLRYVTLRALADSSTDTAEDLRYSALADQLLLENPAVGTTPGLQDWINALADSYRAEAA